MPSEPAIPPVRRGPLALVLTGLVLAVGLALSGAVSVVGDGGEDRTGIRTAAGPQPTVTAAPAGRASTVAPPPATSTPPPTTAALQPAARAGSQAAATTVPACRNSTDPACGDFRFDPQPAPTAS